MTDDITEPWPPPAADILELPVDELALRLLRNLVRVPDSGVTRISCTSVDFLRDYGPSYRDFNVRRALGEAFDWLRFNGYITEHPDYSMNALKPTNRGIALARDPKGLSTMRATARIGVDLHPRIGPKVRRQFLLGEYELAVFAAFKEVEVRVRSLGNFNNSLTTVKLMQEAFKPDGGRLTDKTLEGGEQLATMYLFAGAVGAFKNPASHRQVDYDDVTEASEAVLLADLLMRILDRYDPSA